MSYSKLIMTMSTIKTMMIKINIIWQFIIETPDIQIYSFIFYVLCTQLSALHTNFLVHQTTSTPGSSVSLHTLSYNSIKRSNFSRVFSVQRNSLPGSPWYKGYPLSTHHFLLLFRVYIILYTLIHYLLLHTLIYIHLFFIYYILLMSIFFTYLLISKFFL